MKNILITLVLASFVSMGFSQIKVFSSGNTKIGDTGVAPQSTLDVNGVTTSTGFTARRTNAGATILMDRTDFSAMILGAGTQAGFTFDENFNFDIRRNNRTQISARQLSVGSLMMRGRGDTGFIGMGVVANPSQQLHVSGNVFASSYMTPSDKRLKNEVQDFTDGLNVVMDLDIKSYKYNGKSGISSTNNHIGVIAQELQEVAPYLVQEYVYDTEDEDGEVVSSEKYLSIHDSSIKFVLVNAIKEQQEIINELKSEILEIRALIENRDDDNSIDVDLEGDKLTPQLNQNIPNPFGSQTEIGIFVPETSNSARLVFHTITGAVIKTIQIDEKGKSNISVNADDLSEGIYSYSLIVDGKAISSKKMIKANK